MDDDHRNDSVLRHFGARSRQPRQTALPAGAPTIPVSSLLAFDQGLHNASTQIDDTRFRYIGTTSPVGTRQIMQNRRNQVESMKHSFSS